MHAFRTNDVAQVPGPGVAAVANAFANATGKRIRNLPLKPARVKATLG